MEERNEGIEQAPQKEPTEFVQPLNQQLLKTRRLYKKKESTERGKHDS